MLPNKGGPAMNENIVIPIKTCRLKLWTRWMLETTGWLISLGLLANRKIEAKHHRTLQNI